MLRSMAGPPEQIVLSSGDHNHGSEGSPSEDTASSLNAEAAAPGPMTWDNGSQSLDAAGQSNEDANYQRLKRASGAERRRQARERERLRRDAEEAAALQRKEAQRRAKFEQLEAERRARRERLDAERQAKFEQREAEKRARRERLKAVREVKRLLREADAKRRREEKAARRKERQRCVRKFTDEGPLVAQVCPVCTKPCAKSELQSDECCLPAVPEAFPADDVSRVCRSCCGLPVCARSERMVSASEGVNDPVGYKQGNDKDGM
ncbi:hypothetical protein HPB49_024469 [Dermacentor silvarum]|uniref:Uncharacterized protein n=1 Tax=Dermacentor silvarum TaxID=543639 RepID=A0ACB8CI59_DERSI|nr:hypothetical protein HPB49_024469 [Dermacentor silvarum]